MSLFEDFLSAQLGPEADFTIDYDPQHLATIHLESGARLRLAPDGLALSGDDETGARALAPLLALGADLLKIHDFLQLFPVRMRLDEGRLASASLEAPSELPLWSKRGLAARVTLTKYVKHGSTGEKEIQDIVQGECRILPIEALQGDWDALLTAFEERLDRTRRHEPGFEIACLLLPPTNPDPTWDTWAATLDLAGTPARVERAQKSVAALSPLVRARYAELYALPLPGWLDQLAALVLALGDLPGNPETLHGQPEPGWRRGNGWLDAALGMRVTGLLEWYLPGGLERATLDASAMYDPVPPGREGPLDPRLDMRYRADAPQFITFLGGDSDGLHWGLWYDSPDHLPLIAHNYARDSAETWLDGEDLLTWLKPKIAQATQEAADETLGYDDGDELRPYALGRWRALRVLDLHLAELARRPTALPATEPKALLCPWPRTKGNPAGSPPLALRPGSGTIPEHVPGFSRDTSQPTLSQRRSWLLGARRDLAAGHTAYALALGLYLHWLDAEELRKEAGKLLLSAYTAAGYQPFAEILKAHLLHRDLRSVGVFKPGA